MLVLLILFVVACIYTAMNLPDIKKSNKELEKAEEDRIKAKIRAENLKRKIRRIKKQS